ncbi:uncharacterized protein LOC129905676 [Episyrphus balteatus]|uniref:uncharacterized protein LOC129905676 n=1 Tax=Episyrphus balteatus TaxID=286459 RepID=UPI00248519DA|nr:uncharacterized protein LOC129905676 [Episyrphus balteatus]
MKIIELDAEKAPGERSRSELGKLNWARKVMERISKDTTSKRERSFEEENPQPKKARVLDGVPPTLRIGNTFSDVVKEKVTVAVIDRGNLDGNISPDHWADVRAHLGFRFIPVLEANPGPLPKVSDGGWHQNRAKLIVCDDQRSLHLYKLAVGDLGEIWPGAKLEVVPREEIPCRPRARTLVPALHTSPEMVLRLIQFSNPSMPTHDWKVPIIEKEPVARYRSALVIINKESLDPLAATGGVIQYGFDSLVLKIYKKDVEMARLAGHTAQSEMEELGICKALSAMEVDASCSSSIPDQLSSSKVPEEGTKQTPVSVNDTNQNPASEKDAKTISSVLEDDEMAGSLSDMDTVIVAQEDLLSEDELLNSTSETEDLNATVVEVDRTGCSHAAGGTD